MGPYAAYARILDAGKGNPTGGFGLVVADDVEYPHRLYEEGNMDAPCRVSLGDDSHNDIHCMLDMDELDLYVLGFKLNVLTPVGGCDFVLYEPYIYESWPSGPGPKEVSYTVHPDGTFSDEVNSANGVPICDNDNSRLIVNGPNCCTGDYKLTVTRAETGESTTSVHAWGGETYADCYDGGGWLLKGLKVPEHPSRPTRSTTSIGSNRSFRSRNRVSRTDTSITTPRSFRPTSSSPTFGTSPTVRGRTR